MTATKNLNVTVARRFEDFDSEDHNSWRTHRAVLAKVADEEVGYRGCVGIALVTDNSSCNAWVEYGDRHLLIPDKDVRWLTMVDLPRSRWRAAPDREVHLLSVLRTTVRYGMPSLSPQGVENYFDFRRMPFGCIERGEGVAMAGDEQHDDTLNSDDHPHYFRVGNLLNWSCTSTAVHYRGTWNVAKKAYYRACNIERNGVDTPHLMFGESYWDHVERPFGWMPKPFLGFPQEAADQLFDRATRPGLMSGVRVFTDSFKLAFMADVDCGMPVISHIAGSVRKVRRGVHYHGMPCVVICIDGGDGAWHEIPIRTSASVVVAAGQEVKRGDVVAFDGPELPDGWNSYSLYKKWEGELPRRFGRQQLENCIRMWFDRQLLRIEPGYVHAPASLTSLAALGSADDTKLWWDVVSSQRYYNSGSDAFIFPTIKLGRWDDFRFPIAGDVDCDLTPASANFIPRRDQTVKNSNSDKNTSGKKTGKQAADQAKDNAKGGKKTGGKPAAKPDTKKTPDKKSGNDKKGGKK